MTKSEQLHNEPGGEKQPESAQAEQVKPQIDKAYYSFVHRYFNGRKNEMAEATRSSNERKGIKENTDRDPNDEDVLYEQFLTEQQNALAKMADEKKLGKMQQKEISFAIVELAGTMRNNDLASRWSQSHYEGVKDVPEILKSRDKDYLDSKKLFMESCKKMFENIKISTQIMATEINAVTSKLRAMDVYSVESGENLGVEIISISEAGNLLQDNPEELLKKIDTISHNIVHPLRSMAFLSFKDAKNMENTKYYQKEADDNMDKKQTHCAKFIQLLCKLELIKDEVIKKMYGRTDITPSERKKVDALRY